MEFHYRKGIHLPSDDLWLDAQAPREAAIVSHAHSDHVRRHAVTVATPATVDLVRERYGQRAAAVCHEFRQPFKHGRVQVTLYPAGHVLGSAQVLVDDGNCRLLYSGDVRLRPSVAAEEAEVPPADVVILDTTFGRPEYVFPPEDEIVAGIVRFCESAFAEGATPVLFAYSLGKAQEAIMLLHRHGIRVAAHAAALKLCEIYRRHGLDLPECEALDGQPGPRTAVVCPPHLRSRGVLNGLRRHRTAMLTGWAVERGAKWRYRCDAVFPLSDHCGHDDLLRYVELSGAREVYTIYGFAGDFAAHLQLRGIAGYSIYEATQLALPGLF
jgi:hypothetical protein